MKLGVSRLDIVFCHSASYGFSRTSLQRRRHSKAALDRGSGEGLDQSDEALKPDMLVTIVFPEGKEYSRLAV
jgi:hypothetical protein